MQGQTSGNIRCYVEFKIQINFRKESAHIFTKKWKEGWDLSSFLFVFQYTCQGHFYKLKSCLLFNLKSDFPCIMSPKYHPMQICQSSSPMICHISWGFGWAELLKPKFCPGSKFWVRNVWKNTSLNNPCFNQIYTLKVIIKL